MFTGIVEELGTVRSIEAGANSGSINIAAKIVLDDLQIGDSIAVNGVCLTVTHFDKICFIADVMPETVRCTAFCDLERGSRVNLERALTLQSRLGGHIMSGHVDGVGKISSFTQDENAIIMKIEAGKELLHRVVSKGSVAVDGISLTVVDVNNTWFSVSLIPHTRSVTSLGTKNVGSSINIETDMLGRYVENFLLHPLEKSKKDASRLTKDFLQKYGF